MGSWYKTCGLSQMHITDGEEVMVFALEKNMDQTDRCYSTAFWAPCLVPYYSKYGDYGRGDQDSGVGLPYILEGIRDRLVEMELGDNQYHDIEIKKDKFDIELFYEAVHEGRLFSKDYQGRDRMFEFVMVRKDIADDILANWNRETYVGNGKGDCGYDNAYKMVNFAKILEDLPEFMERVAEFLKPDPDMDDASNSALIGMKLMGGLETVFKYEEDNLVGKWIRGSADYRFSRIMYPSEVVLSLMKVGKVKEATELMIDLLKGLYLNCFMEMTRRNWAPGGHEGSQANEAHGYRIMAEATLRALDREKKEYLEDTGEEEYSEFN
jgi:hypothetical protein